MLTLLELLLPEIAAHHRVAVLIDAISEVLAGHADHATFPVLQLAFVDVVPLLHWQRHRRSDARSQHTCGLRIDCDVSGVALALQHLDRIGTRWPTDADPVSEHSPPLV